jgi:hypothetical protein
MCHVVILEMEVSMETICDDSTEPINTKTNLFRGNREMKVMLNQEFDMKTRCVATQTRLQSNSHRFLHQTEEKSFECNQQEEGTRWIGEGMVYH